MAGTDSTPRTPPFSAATAKWGNGALVSVRSRRTVLIVRNEVRHGPSSVSYWTKSSSRAMRDVVAAVLLDGLPGVSRNLLTERLRDLERDGIVTRHELPPPAARQVYDLTDDGMS